MARPLDVQAIERILRSAEELYGQRGLSAVSLSMIRKLAGSANKNVIGYHFGDEEGLIKAILSRRVPEVERVRSDILLQAIAQTDPLSIRMLMTLLYKPLIDHRDSQGNRTYARFILSLLGSQSGLKWGEEVIALQPSAVIIMRRLLDLIRLPPPLLYERQRLIAIMVLTSVFDRRRPLNDPVLDEALIDNALDMATAAIQVPLSKSDFGTHPL